MLQRADEAEWQMLRAINFGSPASIAALPLAERWIVSQLHQVGWLVVGWLVGWLVDEFIGLGLFDLADLLLRVNVSTRYRQLFHPITGVSPVTDIIPSPPLTDG